VFNAGEGAGKSGSFFFFSHDKKYIIKTMSKEEITVMLKILPNLIEHLRKTPTSLIAKIFGIFTIVKEGLGTVHVMLMENTLQFKNEKSLECVFDLKGSTYDRATKGELKKGTIRKDLDMLSLKKKRPGLFKISAINKNLLKALRRDVHFFKLRGLLDYSLLFAIESSSNKFDEQYEARARTSDFKLG